MKSKKNKNPLQLQIRKYKNDIHRMANAKWDEIANGIANANMRMRLQMIIIIIIITTGMGLMIMPR